MKELVRKLIDAGEKLIGMLYTYEVDTREGIRDTIPELEAAIEMCRAGGAVVSPDTGGIRVNRERLKKYIEENTQEPDRSYANSVIAWLEMYDDKVDAEGKEVTL